MRTILNAIFGSSKNTETIVNGASAGLDKLFFTAEEKADTNAKVADWFLRYLEATNPQNLARRFIAFAVVALWCFLILLGVVAWQWNTSYADFVFATLTDIVAVPFGIIIGFYFAAHIVRGWQQGK